MGLIPSGSTPNLCSIRLLLCFCFVVINKLSLSLSIKVIIKTAPTIGKFELSQQQFSTVYLQNMKTVQEVLHGVSKNVPTYFFALYRSMN